MTSLVALRGALLKYFRDPDNVGVIKDASGIGYVGNPSWGIDMELYIRVEKGIITDAKFKTFGCSASIATSSIVTELVKGKSPEEALKISGETIAESLGGLLPSKGHCSALGEELIRSAVNDYLSKKERKD